MVISAVDTHHLALASTLPVDPRPPGSVSKVVRVLCALLGIVPIAIAICGLMIFPKFEQMFSEIGAVLPPVTGFFVHWGGIYPMGFLALTGLVLTAAGCFARERWVITAFVVALIASVTVFPLTLYLNFTALGEINQQINGQSRTVP